MGKTIFHILIILISLSIGVPLTLYTLTPLPDVDLYRNISNKESIQLTDRNDVLLFDFSQSLTREFTTLDKISPNIIKATITIEDGDFYKHNGIHLKSILRAMYINLRDGNFSQGGSTITQQVVKNTLLTNEKKIIRKIKEFVLAPKLENKIKKDEILEIYLNIISYGGVVRGVESASRTFFKKSALDVTLAEAAYLAAIPNAPSFFSPYGNNKKKLEDRKNQILSLMLNRGVITREEYSQAKSEVVSFKERSEFNIKAPHFVFFVKDRLKEKYGDNLEILRGETIKSTLDYELQEFIQEKIQEYIPTVEEKYGVSNAAALILNAKTGEILSMVGSVDYFNDEVDGSVNIITSKRQTGSTFKPFVYTTAFEEGYTPETVVFDIPTQFNPNCDEDLFESIEEEGCYSPINFSDSFKGPISFKDALAQSVNVPAVKTLSLIGIDDLFKKINKLKIKSILDSERSNFGLSLGLGAADVTPLELGSAYTTFSNDGVFINNVWEFGESNEKKGVRVYEESSARLLNSILSDEEARRPILSHYASIHSGNRDVALKTGTTNNSRDIWVVGYTPNVIVLIWSGNSDGTPLKNNIAGFTLLPLFLAVFNETVEKYSPINDVFLKNTEPYRCFKNILNGDWNKRDKDGKLHTILHYINPNDVCLNITEKEVQRNDSYNNWEFALQNWLEDEENQKIIENKEQKITGQRVDSVSIVKPSEGSVINLNDFRQIYVNFSNKAVRYEFYINNKLVGTSRLPFIVFDNEDFIDNDDESLLIKVVIYSSFGVYNKEVEYSIE